ncbi:MAG: FmdB family zinc ribbon protein [Casimicrobiaceae bacterium]
MPIYEYACPDCGYHGEHMQKLADPPIDRCPRCGSTAYAKKISAAGFALKGTGWYVTDFKGGGSTSAGKADKNGATAPGEAKTESSAESGSRSGASPASPACGAGACPACAD